jgi:hypothetical protein
MHTRFIMRGFPFSLKTIRGDKMEFGQNEKKYEEKQPVFERNISKSKDENWVIIKTIRTDIIHRNYLGAILRNNNENA